MKTEHLDLEIKKLTHSQNYEGITETQQKRLNEFIDIKKQLALCSVSQRYDVSKYTPPFRVGRKQGKAVLDGKGLEVVFFMHSEEQAKMYCDYLNNVC